MGAPMPILTVWPGSITAQPTESVEQIAGTACAGGSVAGAEVAGAGVLTPQAESTMPASTSTDKRANKRLDILLPPLEVWANQSDPFSGPTRTADNAGLSASPPLADGFYKENRRNVRVAYSHGHKTLLAGMSEKYLLILQ
jgi:hypothetical protein